MRRPPLALLLSALLAACGGDDDGASTDAGPPDATGLPDGSSELCGSGTTIALEPAWTGLSSPVLLTSPPGDARMFVVERGGVIKVIADGAVLPTPFLDLTDLVTGDDSAKGSEQGLLGLAFHPDFATNRRFYVFYTGPGGASGTNVVEEYLASAADPDVADPTSGTVILSIDDIASNHNGGMIAFGPDGMLYVGTGDGGGADDPGNNGQDVAELLGKILRIDVDGGDPYGIPADNPLVDSVTANVKKEIWHVGLRNPWRWSFDRQTGDMWIGDVGQGSFEEVDRIAAGDKGKNLGWDQREGTICHQVATCDTPPSAEPAAAYTDPVATYPNPAGNSPASVVGGFVYRGTCFPDLVGTYFFTDVYSSVLSKIDADQAPYTASEVDYGTPVQYPIAFGEDAAGELYLLTQFDGIFHIVARP